MFDANFFIISAARTTIGSGESLEDSIWESEND